MYLDLLKKCLTRSVFEDELRVVRPHRGTVGQRLFSPVEKILAQKDFVLARWVRLTEEERATGAGWPGSAETMIGHARLDNIQDCVVDVVVNDIPGDLIEAGVWRGGAGILMRAVLEVLADEARAVWLADSFRGLPPPRPDIYPLDADDTLWRSSALAIPVSEVESNFRRYGLLDERVRFIEGFFSESLPTASIEEIAVLRVDGDMYESTWAVLTNLYEKVSTGGYVIIDDYGCLAPCKAAVDDFRRQTDINQPLLEVDWTAVYWQKVSPQ